MFSNRTLLTDTELLKLRETRTRKGKGQNGQNNQNYRTNAPKLQCARETGTTVAGSTAQVLQFLFKTTKLCDPRKMFNFHFQFAFYIFHFLTKFTRGLHRLLMGGRMTKTVHCTEYLHCVHHETNQLCVRLSCVHSTCGFVSQPERSRKDCRTGAD
jgi:hypothetical protein